MPKKFSSSVFINCPFDEDFAPLLEAMIFCVIYAGLCPRLSSERLEAGESRFEKILEIISNCQYSIHDLSMSVSSAKGEFFRMNMPFELGIDMGFRRAPDAATNSKKFIIFEKEPYDLKRALSDLSGADVAYHRGDFRSVIKSVRDFLRVEAKAALPGATKLETEYYTFQGWMLEKKISEGHTEDEATNLPTQERLDEMNAWVNSGKPQTFA